MTNTEPLVAAAGPGASVAHTAGALLLVLAVIFALAWLARRMQNLRPAIAGALRVQGGLQVGARERVLWIKAGETHLLIGVAPGRVQTLHVFDKAPEADAPGAIPAAAGAPNFADLLKRALGKD